MAAGIYKDQEARKAYLKAYYEAHKDEIKKRHKNYYQTNKEHLKRASREQYRRKCEEQFRWID